jgi:sensor domain CHASE-containing protein
MRKFLAVLPLIALIAACSNNDSLENKGREAGAAADNAIERVENRVDAERDEFENRAANVSEKARAVKQDIKEGLSKADNAADAAAAELRK